LGMDMVSMWSCMVSMGMDMDMETRCLVRYREVQDKVKRREHSKGKGKEDKANHR